jgi:hypothetical protein
VAVYGGFAGTETQLSERSWSSYVTTLSGDISASGDTSDNSYHVVIGATGAILDGFTISGGKADGADPYNKGGGIYNASASPVLRNLIISGNASSNRGGGIYSADSNPTLVNLTVSNNTSVGGGGIYNLRSSPAMSNITITNNQASQTAGGLWNSFSSPTLTSVTIKGNTAGTSGGGMYNTASNPILSDATIVENTTSTNGGGIYNGSSSPILTNVLISSNTAGNDGGGIYNTASSPTLANVTISGNQAGTNGGGMINFSNSSPTLTDVLISGNTASWGGGLANATSSSTLTNVTISGNAATWNGGIDNDYSGTLQIRNSIIWGNTAGGSASAITNANGSTATVSYSLVEGGYAGTGNLSSDPQFISSVAAASAPTASGNYRLLTTSPAIDAGDNSVVSVTTDLDGNSRLVDLLTVADTGNGSAPMVDMGAYEALPVVQISSITRLDPAASLTNATSVQFQVVFAESVGAAEVSDFAASVVSGNISGVGISSVSGGGATYSVTVNTGSGDGVLRLEPAPGALVLNAASAIRAIASFSSGETYTIDKSIAAPIITGITTDSGIAGDGITNDRTLIFSGSAEAGSTVTLTRVGTGEIGTTTADSNGVWSFDYTTTSLQDGSYSFTATASDTLGNTSASSSPFVVTVQRMDWFVNDDASGANTGASWADAFTSLQSALAVAESGDQIWVAAGAYTPTTTTDRTASFTLTSGVAMYGGFAGTETQLNERNWTTNVTILSGDLNGNDSSFTNNAENSYHVVVGATGATLDGFTITGGNANGSDPYNKGGGIYNASANPTLSNLIVTSNQANYGGGISNDNGSSAMLTNVTISGNSATGTGGGIYNNNSSSPILTNVLISGNLAWGPGGGIYANAGSSLTLTNVTIANNLAFDYGCGIWIRDGDLQIQNSIFWGNAGGNSQQNYPIHTEGSGNTVVNYSLVERGYNGTGNLNRDPHFMGAVGAGSAPTASGNYRLLTTSPAIDAGDNSVVSATTDRAGNPRRVDLVSVADTGSGTMPLVDMGAYEALPVVQISSITRLDPAASLTNATSVEFQVVFAESVSSVDASDFAATVVSGNISGASVTGVSGSGSSYTLTVATGSGDGVLRLEPSATARVADASSAPAEVSTFTNGESYTIDKTAPAAPAITGITTDSGTASDGITNDRTIVFSGTAEAGSTVTLTRVGTGEIGTTTADINGAWSFDYTSISLEDGSYSFTATSSDTLVNTSASSSPFAVTVQRMIWYVNDNATGTNTGVSWINAFTSLQSALAVVESGDQIWVAAGTYKPTTTTDRTASLALKNGVAVYGGFAASETQLSERNWTSNVTSLSGDIGLTGDTSDNSYHVVIGVTGATLDGFTISGGNADGGGEGEANGGGIYNGSSSPTLRNLIISANSATMFGGGIYNNASSPTLTNVTISGNRADFIGGGIANDSSSPTLTNVMISSNSVSFNGGGIGNYNNSSPMLTNVTISGNQAGTTGGGVSNFESSNPQIRNSIIWGNQVGATANSFTNENSTPVVSYSIVEGGYIGTGNLDSDPLFVSAIDAASAPTSSGDYRLQATSPAIDAGDNSVVSATTDRAGNPRRIDLPSVTDTGSGIVPIVDMGAYERQGQPNQQPTLNQPANLVILEDAIVQTVSLTGIGAGNGESQTLSITAVSSNPTLIPNPTISYTIPNTSGNLSFTPVGNGNGSATITITMRDSGGTASSGVDMLTRSFSVTVSAVNDAPSFTAGANQSVEAGAGQQTITGWASGFSAGPADEASQTPLGYSVVSNTNSELFSVAPAIDASGTLTYTPKPGASGTATISVVARDSGGTANGGVDTSAVRTFTITVGGSYSIYLPLVLRP